MCLHVVYRLFTAVFTDLYLRGVDLDGSDQHYDHQTAQRDVGQRPLSVPRHSRHTLKVKPDMD